MGAPLSQPRAILKRPFVLKLPKGRLGQCPGPRPSSCAGGASGGPEQPWGSGGALAGGFVWAAGGRSEPQGPGPVPVPVPAGPSPPSRGRLAAGPCPRGLGGKISPFKLLCAFRDASLLLQHGFPLPSPEPCSPPGACVPPSLWQCSAAFWPPQGWKQNPSPKLGSIPRAVWGQIPFSWGR